MRAKAVAVATATRTRAYCLSHARFIALLTAQPIHAISLSKDKNSCHSFAISLAWFMRTACVNRILYNCAFG